MQKKFSICIKKILKVAKENSQSTMNFYSKVLKYLLKLSFEPSIMLCFFNVRLLRFALFLGIQ